MILRGQIYLANLKNKGSDLIKKIRPVVIISNNTGNRLSGIVTVACITSKLHKKQSTHVFIKKQNKLKPGFVLCEQVYTIDKSQLIAYLGDLTEKQIYKLNIALRIALGIY